MYKLIIKSFTLLIVYILMSGISTAMYNTDKDFKHVRYGKKETPEEYRARHAEYQNKKEPAEIYITSTNGHQIKLNLDKKKETPEEYKARKEQNEKRAQEYRERKALNEKAEIEYKKYRKKAGPVEPSYTQDIFYTYTGGMELRDKYDDGSWVPGHGTPDRIGMDNVSRKIAEREEHKTFIREYEDRSEERKYPSTKRSEKFLNEYIAVKNKKKPQRGHSPMYGDY